MKVLYLTLDPPLNPGLVATGNQVRAQGILETIGAAGVNVYPTYPANPEAANTNNDSAASYKTGNELAENIAQGDFDAILVGYWSLLSHLPELDIPIILDFIAPRMLELMYQEPENISVKAIELINELGRADHFLVGNQRQADLLLPLLLQAGFDCRQQAPISLVPISTRGITEQVFTSSTLLRVVNAGVKWPWRNSEAYTEILRQISKQDSSLELVEVVGSYPGEKLTKSKSTLLSYAEMQKQLLQSDIGLELGEQNLEREFSHSFRSIEYLECGLPIIINAWIPLAAKIKEYEAGWVVQSPEEMREVVNALIADKTLLESKREGVRNLVKAELNYRKSCEPLIALLNALDKPRRFYEFQQSQYRAQETPILKEFEEDKSVKKESPLKVFLGAVVRKLFFPNRPDKKPDILMVTRADLFPVDHGAAVKIIRTAEALSRQGLDVWLTTDNRGEYYQFNEGKMFTHRFPFYIRFFCLPRIVAFARLLLKGYPVSNHFLYLPVTDISYIIRTIWLAGRKPVGAYQAEFPAYVRPCRFARSLFGGKILLVQHNVEYERIKEQVPGLTEKNYTVLKNLEVAMCRLADNIVAVSENDRTKMINAGIDAAKIHTIPHGVDLQNFKETKSINIHENYGLPAGNRILVYHGTYSYPPNLEAMQVMAKEILPRLEQRGIDVSVLAIGSKPPNFPLHDRIHFVGSVDNLAEVIPAADLAVVTLQQGGGTRMKILDYFAAGIPVISTSKGIEGIPVKKGIQALIEDDTKALCDAIELLLAEPEQAEMLVTNAGEFVQGLGWDKIVRRYLLLLQ